MIDRRKQLLDWYGITFPDDLFAVWELACKWRPSAPRDAFAAIGLQLDGVFDVLAGQFDQKPPDGPLWTHGMSYNDPPEFFTIFWGGCDGYHFGLWFDDPIESPTCVVSYYNSDAYDLAHYPANLFLTLRRELELSYASIQQDLEYFPADAADYEEQLRQKDELREVLKPWMPGAARRRTQTGQRYEDRYQDELGGEVVGCTWGAECISAPRHLYCAPAADNETIWREVRKAKGARRWLAQAEQALQKGYPATALKLGKDLWHLAPKEIEGDACRVLVAAYCALGRPLLAEVLKARKDQRDQWDALRQATSSPVAGKSTIKEEEEDQP
jgi:hypothetical protein